MSLMRLLVKDQVKRKRCWNCDQVTLQHCRGPTLAAMLFASILTCGAFFFFWQAMRWMGDSTCSECDARNGFGPVGYYWRRGNRNEHQFAQHRMKPPEAQHDSRSPE